MDRNFEAFLIKYEKKVFNLIYRLLGDYDDAADVTQEVFVRAFKSFKRFRGEAAPYTWLSRIAVNLCKNKFKEYGRRKLVKEVEEASIDWEGLKGGVSDGSESPERIVERKELQEYVQRCIGALPDDFRVVVVLRDLQGLSYQEIADVLGVSTDIVRVRIFRARKLLKDKLAPLFKS